MLFQELQLIEPLLRAVQQAGYVSPSPIQAAAIPPALSGRDVLGCAQTGTGKTAAFSLPILQRVDASAGDDPKLRALILTPTRELAAQIGESLATYGAELDLYSTVIFGGVSEQSQLRELRKGVDILVATPGRLLDFLNRGLVSLDTVEIFVLDEADRMLDMGFVHDVKKITAKLPQKRQTLFFSATMPDEIRHLADGLLSNPEFVSVTPVSSTAERIEQKIYFVDKANKRKLLVDCLRDPDCVRCLVFSRTKHGANRIVKELDRAGIRSAAIHGNKSQGARTRALEDLKNGQIRVLIATDIAARGIDVDGVSHVINYDIPNIPETYVHRIGRTARAGREGIAVSFCEDEERPYLRDIERLIGLHVSRVLDHRYPPQFEVPSETDLRPGARRAEKKPSQPQGQARRSGGGRSGGRPRAGAPRREGSAGAQPERAAREGGAASPRPRPGAARREGASPARPAERGREQSGARPRPAGAASGGGRRPQMGRSGAQMRKPGAS